MSAAQPIPILVLTLPGAEARRAPLVASLTALGLECELVFGVDGRRGIPSEYEDRVDRRATWGLKPRRLTDPEFGCALSHLAIYDELIARTIPLAIVLEDDARVGGALAAFARGEIRSPGDLILFDYWKGGVVPDGAVPIAPGLRAHRVRLPPALTTGYAITQAGARHIRDRAFPIRRPADWPCDITRMHAVMIHPRIVDHPGPGLAESTIETDRADMASEARRDPGLLARLRNPQFWLHEWRKRRCRRLPDVAALDLDSG